MSEVSTFRLYLLRAMYVFMVVGLAIFKLGPAILDPENLSPQDSVVISVLGAFALLAVLGIRYPLKMLPLLLFEFAWKLVWVLAFGLPLLQRLQGTPTHAKRPRGLILAPTRELALQITTVLKPPCTAAADPVAIVSFALFPGSRKWT